MLLNYFIRVQVKFNPPECKKLGNRLNFGVMFQNNILRKKKFPKYIMFQNNAQTNFLLPYHQNHS